MREAISKALTSSLEWDDSDHERAIDKLTAFSYSDRLGTLLWRLKYQHDHTAYKPILHLIAKRLPRINRGIALRVAKQALHEWLYNFCPTCCGAKEIRRGELVVICAHCSGSGVRKYRDSERRHAIGAAMNKRVDELLSLIGGMDVAVSVGTKSRLAR